MNLDVRKLLPALLVAIILGLILAQTSEALRRAGSWGKRPRAQARTVDPYARLDGQLAKAPPALIGPMRDPFAFGYATSAVRPVVTRTTPAPRVVPKPVLTAIIMDVSDPRALVRFEERNYTVKEGDLFAEFRVVSISADQVVLDGGGQRHVLRRPAKGE